jgi:hypothetical protein
VKRFGALGAEGAVRGRGSVRGEGGNVVFEGDQGRDGLTIALLLPFELL